MPDRLPENAAPPADFTPGPAARDLLRRIRAGTLATLDRNTGHPFASLVNIGTDADGSPIILISRLSTHTANLEADGRASIMLAETGKGDALAHPRLTVLGQFILVPREAADEGRLRRRFLAHHPKSQLYAGFADFAFWRMQVVSAHLNGGFARAADLTASDILTDIVEAQALIDAEEGAVAHMNEDHGAALNLYAVKFLGAPDGVWRCTGIDPDGLDLQNGPLALRLPFPQRVADAGALRMMLKQLAEQARAM
ncbi:HugZ family protein [Undibacter mobilis]|uniref:HugZ family protein n=2 Tax=Undibacter mobilis TaxID=2292256 RepID=A0A371BEC3_9BRAD|nr:HugZ family protein [Undibacter mobilis]